jgi:hypothetical protein
MNLIQPHKFSKYVVFMKSYNDKIATISAIIAIIAIVVSIITPEIRSFFLGKEPESPITQPEISVIDSLVTKKDSLINSTNDSTKIIIESPPTIVKVDTVTTKPKKINSSKRVNEFENITYFGTAGNLEGKITFYNTDGNSMEFTGVLSIYSVNGRIVRKNNTFTIVESDNCKGKFTLLEDNNKIIGTAIILASHGEEPLSIDLHKNR